MLLTFLLVLGARAEPPPGDHRYRPAFHHEDCAAFLLDHVDDLRDAVLDDVPAALDAEVGRARVEGPPADFALDHVPDFQWFVAEAGAPAREVEARIVTAAAEVANAANFQRGHARLALIPGDRPLGPVERRALGVDVARDVRPSDLRGAVTRNGPRVDVHWLARGVPAGEFALDAADVVFGYTNSVYWWQYLMLNVACRGRRGPPGGRFKPRVRDWFETEVRAMFTRAAGEKRFGYFLTTYDLGRARPVHEVEIVEVRPSGRVAAGAGDIVFPRPGDPPGRINWRVSDLGLRLQMTSDRASE